MTMFTIGSADPSALDRGAPSALHTQISDAIRANISSGMWPAHHRLKPEPELAADFGVSRGTVRRALSTLIEDGLLRQVQGRGTFVTETLLEPAVAQKLSTLSEDFSSQGVQLLTTVLSVALVDPPPTVAKLLRVVQGQQVMRLVRVRSTDKRSVALLHNYVRTDLTPGIEQLDFAEHSLFGILEGQFHVKIATARRTFSALAAIDEVATALDIAPGAPVQYLEQLTLLADGNPIEYSDVWINSAELRVVSHLSRR